MGQNPFDRPVATSLAQPWASGLVLVALCAGAFTGACHRPAAGRGVNIEWTLTPTPAAVGKAHLTLRVIDDGRPVRGARLRVEGHMSHPGMAPSIASAVEGADGLYVADLQFTMPGDWILLVSGTLPNGAAVERRIDVPGVRQRAADPSGAAR
jgi:YtkA-like